MTLATPVGSKYPTFGDVVTDLKANKPVSYGTISSGSLAHLAMTLLGKSGGLGWDHVPYKGGGPMMQDAIGGRVPLVHRFTKTGTNEIDGFFRQARRESAAVLKYGKILQRSMAEKDAISCLGFSETVY